MDTLETQSLDLTRLLTIKERVLPLAQQVGRWARQESDQHFLGHGDIGVSEKTSPGDVVTRVDVEAQRRIATALSGDYPDFGLLGEEGLNDFDDQAPVWVIDPIDGTHNFVRNYPSFCVSIGLVVRGESVLGVIYDAATDEVVWAVKGGGAWRGERRLKLEQDLPHSHALLATNFTRPMKDDERQLRFFAQAAGTSAGVRASGSACRDLCFVADGRVDLFWQFGLQAWDVAAGMVIAREAGATVELWQNGGDWLRAPGLALAAGTATVAAQLKQLAQEHQLID